MAQNWIVGVLVVLAVLYSLWYLLPHVARRYLARLHTKLGPAPSCGSGCGSCGKCDDVPVADPDAALKSQQKPLTFHRHIR